MGFFIEGSLSHLSFQIAYRSENPGEENHTYGLRLGIYNSNSPQDRFTGVEMGIANNEAGDVDGVAVGLYNSANHFRGVSLACENVARQMTGLNIGLVNATERRHEGEGNMTGVQLSAWNYAGGDMKGFQLGVLMNFAQRMYGVQAGFVNSAANLWEGGIQLIIPLPSETAPEIEP